MSLQDEVLAALIHIQQHGPLDPKLGICNSVNELFLVNHPGIDTGEMDKAFNEIDDLLTGMMSNWKHHSGSMAYPIADPEGKASPSSYFWNMGNEKWDLNTKAGQLRLDLLNHTIDQLKIQLSKT